jgi:hypothetical protein
MGIWEIMNEMHGTTAYVADHAAGREWSNKMHALIKEWDHFDRPTTASYGGAEAWYNYGVEVDMPNVHYYEGQGYPRPFNDAVRDGLFNMVQVYSELKQTPDRPAFLGEAGYTTMFADAGTQEYAEEFHNAFWAGLTNGIASTPFWWDFTTRSIFTDLVLEQYGLLKDFAEPLNLSKVNAVQTTITVPGSNAYAMEADTMAFAWFWSYDYDDVSGLQAKLHGLDNHSYSVSWYNTWTGETVETQNEVSAESILTATAPDLAESEKDIAFRVKKIENGAAGSESKLGIMLKEASLKPTNTDSARTIIAYITDSQGRLVNVSDYPVNFTLTGPGSLSAGQVLSDGGIAIVRYTPDLSSDEDISITVEAEGLSSGSISSQMATGTEKSGLEIPDEFALSQNFPNPFNPTTQIQYAIPAQSTVSLKVFNVTGQLVQTLVSGSKSPGNYTATFDASNLSSGIYFYRIEAGAFIKTEQMMLIK